MGCIIEDWAGNKPYGDMVFATIDDAWDFLTEDQHKRHPDVTEDEFIAIMGEFCTAEAE